MTGFAIAAIRRASSTLGAGVRRFAGLTATASQPVKTIACQADARDLRRFVSMRGQ
jgi:hypothetical protein